MSKNCTKQYFLYCSYTHLCVDDDKVVDIPEEEDLPALDTPIPDPPTPAKQTTRRKTKKRSLYSRIFGSSSESEIDESSDSTTNEDKVPPNEMEMENNQQSKEITEPTPIEPPSSEPPLTELPPAEPPSMEATLIQPPPIEFTIQEDSNDSFFSSSDMEVDFPPPVIDSQDKQPQMTTEEPPKETNSTEKTSPSKSSFRNDPGLIPIALLPRTDTRSPSPEKPNSEDEQSSSSDSSSSYKYTRRSVFMSEKEIISGSTTRRSPDSSRKRRTHSNRTRSRSRSSSYERREKRHKSSRSSHHHHTSHHHHHHRERPPHQNAVDPLSRATATSIYEATCALAETLHIYRDSPYNPEQIVNCNPLTKNTVRSPVKINSPSVYSLPPEQPARSYPSSEMYDPLKVDYSFSSYRESSSRSNGLSSNKKSYY